MIKDCKDIINHEVLRFLPNNVHILKGNELAERLEDLNKKGVLERDTLGNGCYIYEGIVRGNGLRRKAKERFNALATSSKNDGFAMGLFFMSNSSITRTFDGLVYLGSDNRIYPIHMASKDEIMRLVIDC